MRAPCPRCGLETKQDKCPQCAVSRILEIKGFNEVNGKKQSGFFLQVKTDDEAKDALFHAASYNESVEMRVIRPSVGGIKVVRFDGEFEDLVKPGRTNGV